MHYFLFFIIVITQTVLADTKVQARNDITVFKQDNLQSEKIAIIKRGEKFYISERKGYFFKIKAGSISEQGWIIISQVDIITAEYQNNICKSEIKNASDINIIVLENAPPPIKLCGDIK